jgi:imidazolonepropionase-like amidohydrolase
VLDLGAQTWLLPGLIDSHVHLSFDASPAPVASLTACADGDLLPRLRKAARTALLAGITTVRDLGDRDFASLALAAEFERRPGTGPEILAAGPPLTSPGGHCHFLGGETAGIGALRAAVRERHARGCSVIKIMASGGSLTPGSALHQAQYSLAELKAVVDEAHGLGLPVAAHTHAKSSIADAIEAGADTIEHVTFMTANGSEPDPELLKAIADSGVFVGVTAGRDTTSHPMRPQLVATLKVLNPAFRQLHELGANLVLSSDSGIAPSKPHDVLPLCVAQSAEIGMSPQTALAAVTSTAARACRVEGRKGQISVGADADFLAVQGNPLEDLTRLRNVRAVFRAGVQVR